MESSPLSADLLQKMDAYWRAANYLSVGQIYLYDNPLLKRPLRLSDIKRMLLGHWGTTPGQNFIYVHLNRVIKQYDLNMVYVSGPGHGGRPWSATPTSKAATARSTPTSARTKRGCGSFSCSSPSREAFPAMCPRNAPARSTRGENWAIHSAIRSGRCLIIRISLSLV